MNTQKMKLSDSELNGVAGGLIDTKYGYGRCIACSQKGEVSLAFLPKGGHSRSKSAVVNEDTMRTMLSKNCSQQDIDGFMEKIGSGYVEDLSETEMNMVGKIFNIYVY